MLQQTQVARVVPRYEAWLARWPTVEALADASAADVIRAWQGLGYNRRALNLHRASAARGRERLAGRPHRAARGGRYTADAVARFAYDLDVLPVDTNVRRVLDRTGEPFGPDAAHAPHGSRRDDLPGAHPALRRLPARRALSLTRQDLRATPETEPLRGSFRQRRAQTPRLSRKDDARSPSSTVKLWRPCGRTDSSSSRATASSSRISGRNSAPLNPGNRKIRP